MIVFLAVEATSDDRCLTASSLAILEALLLAGPYHMSPRVSGWGIPTTCHLACDAWPDKKPAGKLPV